MFEAPQSAVRDTSLAGSLIFALSQGRRWHCSTFGPRDLHVQAMEQALTSCGPHQGSRSDMEDDVAMPVCTLAAAVQATSHAVANQVEHIP